MGRPHVSFDLSDGKVQTYVTAGDQTMTYWDSDFNGTINSTDTGENPWEDFEEESQEQALEWGKEVHERIDSATYGIMIETSNNERVSDLIVAYATGQEPSAGPDLADKATRDTYVIRTAAKVAKAQRELQQVYMNGPAQELRGGSPTSTRSSSTPTARTWRSPQPGTPTATRLPTTSSPRPATRCSATGMRMTTAPTLTPRPSTSGKPSASGQPADPGHNQVTKGPASAGSFAVFRRGRTHPHVMAGNLNRRPKGTPTGGQFTSFPHLEPSVASWRRN